MNHDGTHLSTILLETTRNLIIEYRSLWTQYPWGPPESFIQTLIGKELFDTKRFSSIVFEEHVRHLYRTIREQNSIPGPEVKELTDSTGRLDICIWKKKSGATPSVIIELKHIKDSTTISDDILRMRLVSRHADASLEHLYQLGWAWRKTEDALRQLFEKCAEVNHATIVAVRYSDAGDNVDIEEGKVLGVVLFEV